jgi:DNA-directed RNA polymerase subunit RPC12/RpoP
MYSPKIKEQLIPVIYNRARREHKPMTAIINELIEESLYKIYYCRNCNNQIEAEKGTKEAYCDHCQSEVYLITSSL